MTNAADLIQRLISGPEGFQITLFDHALFVCRLSSGKYHVFAKARGGLPAIAEEFLHPRSAVEFFLEVRQERGIGFDSGRFEDAPSSKPTPL